MPATISMRWRGPTETVEVGMPAAPPRELGLSPRCRLEVATTAGPVLVVGPFPIAAAGCRSSGLFRDVFGVERRSARWKPTAAPRLTGDAVVLAPPDQVSRVPTATWLSERRLDRILVDESAIRNAHHEDSAPFGTLLATLHRLSPNTPVRVLAGLIAEPRSVSRYSFPQRDYGGVVVTRLARHPVHLRIEMHSGAPKAELLARVHARRHQRGLIYAASEVEARGMTRLLRLAGLPVTSTQRPRQDRSDALTLQEGSVSVAVTGATDPNPAGQLEYVLHMNPPQTLEQYLDDLEPAFQSRRCPVCILLASPRELETRNDGNGRTVFAVSEPSQRDRTIVEYCLATTCRHRVLSRHFDPQFPEPLTTDAPCYQCDNCLRQTPYLDDDVRWAET